MPLTLKRPKITPQRFSRSIPRPLRPPRALLMRSRPSKQLPLESLPSSHAKCGGNWQKTIKDEGGAAAVELTNKWQSGTYMFFFPLFHLILYHAYWLERTGRQEGIFAMGDAPSMENQHEIWTGYRWLLKTIQPGEGELSQVSGTTSVSCLRSQLMVVLVVLWLALGFANDWYFSLLLILVLGIAVVDTVGVGDISGLYTSRW